MRRRARFAACTLVSPFRRHRASHQKFVSLAQSRVLVLTTRYTIKYSHCVTSEDMYLPSPNKTPSICDADALSVSIDLPQSSSADVSLEVTRWELNVRTPLYRLKLPLPHPVDEDRGTAIWEKDRGQLVIRIPILKDV